MTGAAGLVGSHLVERLLEEGLEVRALIRNTPLSVTHPNLEVVRGEIEDRARLFEVTEGVDTVFHTAARLAMLGGPSCSAEYRASAHRTNVGGTQNVVDACRERGVRRLVHTSSIDVCFDYRENLGMNRSTPYAVGVPCVYSETKILAEQAVLAANDEATLMTTALRPAGIYGTHSNLMLDGLFEQLLAGKFVATIGGPGALQEAVYVDNLVHAEVLAAKNLTPGSPVCGRAYFVTDNHRVPIFEFMRPFVEGLGYEMPKRSIPAGAMLAAAKCWQWLHFRFGAPAPSLAPHEVYKISVSHHGSIQEAHEDFGYTPLVPADRAMELCIEHYQKKRSARAGSGPC